MKPESWYKAARFAGKLRRRSRKVHSWPVIETIPGISVVIPSRNGKDLLAAQLPGITKDLVEIPSEILVVDNGSSDGTADWLCSVYPRIRVEVSPTPLSFARAVNRGIALARHSHICLLNNDMIVEAGFFSALLNAFQAVPDLFSATAQIFFPPGVRREETGKAVYSQPSPIDFPIRCDEPFPGEDHTYVLYGSGGCSLYDTAKLRQLGAIDPVYEPAYVEDLDIGYRGWQIGWPSIYVAGARLEHRHRATSSRYFTEEQLEEILEVNYLRFVARAVADRDVFQALWLQALNRLRLRAGESPAARKALQAAPGIALTGGPRLTPKFQERLLLALSAGGIAVFPGHGPIGNPRTVVVGCAPRPGAVMISSVESLQTPDPESLAICAEVVLVRRSDGPLALEGVLQQSVRKWRPEAAYLGKAEMSQFAGYFRACGITTLTCPSGL